MMPFDYIKEPQEIYRNSFQIIQSEANIGHLPKNAQTIAIRLAHACGMVEVAEKMEIHDDFIEEATKALTNGKPIYVDTQMVRHGIIAKRLKNNNRIICTLNDDNVPLIAKEHSTTLSAAATELWQEADGALIVIGNAPTALFHILEAIEADKMHPGAIVGLPVGFVGAAESKEALKHFDRTPWLTLPGRLGGSAMASSVVNALAGLED